MTYRVGVDIGGTFTDFAVLDDANELYTLKVFSDADATRARSDRRASSAEEALWH